MIESSQVCNHHCVTSSATATPHKPLRPGRVEHGAAGRGSTASCIRQEMEEKGHPRRGHRLAVTGRACVDEFQFHLPHPGIAATLPSPCALSFLSLLCSCPSPCPFSSPPSRPFLTLASPPPPDPRHARWIRCSTPCPCCWSFLPSYNCDGPPNHRV
jgi:hypothetical protein